MSKTLGAISTVGAFVGFVLNVAMHNWETAGWAFAAFLWALSATLERIEA